MEKAELRTSEISKFFELEEEGRMRDTLTGARVFILSKAGWRAFNEEIESTFPGSSSVLMTRMGHAYGRALARAAKRVSMGPNETYEAMFELAKSAGWGEMSLCSGDASTGRWVLRIKHCVFCESMVAGKAETCNFVPGVVQGVADEIEGGLHRVAEVRCICKGDPSCEIAID